MRKLILASASPRRVQILQKWGFVFETLACPLEERPPLGSGVRWRCAVLAAQKARYAAQRRPDAVILGADTTVCLDGACLGKPRDETDAARMLRALSDRTHSVFSGVCLLDAVGKRETLFVRESRVTFRPLSEDWIVRYVASGEPMDKAGAYAIQGGAAEAVAAFEGEYENIVGLPIRDTAAYLHDFGIDG